MDSDLAETVITALTIRKWQLTTVESCTGGMVFSALTNIAGASAALDRGFITYSNQAKMDMVSVEQQCLLDFGAVSAETAKQMAQGGLLHSGADIATAITGIAGPNGGTTDKPVGLVYIHTATKYGTSETIKEIFAGDRQMIRNLATITALQHIQRLVKTSP